MAATEPRVMTVSFLVPSLVFPPRVSGCLRTSDYSHVAVGLSGSSGSFLNAQRVGQPTESAGIWAHPSPGCAGPSAARLAPRTRPLFSLPPGVPVRDAWTSSACEQVTGALSERRAWQQGAPLLLHPASTAAVLFSPFVQSLCFN